MTGLLLDNIGSLVTNDPGIGQGPLGLVRDAAMIFEGGVVAWAGPWSKVPGGGTDTRVDAEGRAVIPGFVDSHAARRPRRSGSDITPPRCSKGASSAPPDGA